MAGVPALPDHLELRTDRPNPMSSFAGPRALWSIYLDDFGEMNVLQAANLDKHVGLPTKQQLLLRRHYAVNDIPRSEEKSVEGATHATHLGYLFDGLGASLRISGTRAMELLSIGLCILNGDRLPLLVLQIFSGKMAHAIQLRRPLWSLLSDFWLAFAMPEKTWLRRRLTGRARTEVLGLLCLMPLCCADLGGPIDGLVTASDASEEGLGVSRTVKLSTGGLAFVHELRQHFGVDAAPMPSVPQEKASPRTVLVSMFDGIGGARRALERLHVPVCVYVSVEIDKCARRVTRAAWPGVVELGSVEAVTRHTLGPHRGSQVHALRGFSL